MQKLRIFDCGLSITYILPDRSLACAGEVAPYFPAAFWLKSLAAIVMIFA